MMNRNKYYWYDQDHNIYPVSLDEWARRFEHDDRVLAKTDIGDTQVSTVFLGLDHNMSGEGLPILWETMVFGGEYGGYDLRYDTYQAAAEGHAHAVLQLMVGQPPFDYM